MGTAYRCVWRKLGLENRKEEFAAQGLQQLPVQQAADGKGEASLDKLNKEKQRPKP